MAMRKSNLLLAAVGFVAGGLAGALLYFKDSTPIAAIATAPRPAWHEVQWPFLLDQWGKGKAFRCNAADCGTEVNVYIRAKIGFCDCSRGVSDDDELDRISDFDLMGKEPVARGPGREISVA